VGEEHREHSAKVIQSVKASISESSANKASQYDRKPNGTNVNLAFSAVVGVIMTCAVYLVVLTVLEGTYVNTLLAHRGWVQYAIILLACWAAAILLLKYNKIRGQRVTLSLDALPLALGENIRADNAGRFREHLDSLRCDVNHNFLVRRIAKAIDHVEAGFVIENVAGLLKSHGEIDASSVQSSYTILKVIIWAIPIFGFLGTVIGIGAAVAQFSGSLEGMQTGGRITELLGPVIGGLAVAFDTTLLALMMSLLVMFPTSWLEKKEDDLLISIDEYCQDRLLIRLDSDRAQEVPDQEGFRNLVSELLSKHQMQMDAWLKRLSTIGAELTNQIAYGWSVVHQKLCEANESSLRRIQEISAGLASDQMQLASKMQGMQDRQIDHFQNVMKALTEGIRIFHQQTHKEYLGEVKMVQGMASQLSETLFGVKEEAKAMQAGMSRTIANYQEVFGHLTQICRDLTEQVGAMEKRLAEAENSQQSAVKDLVDRLAQERVLASNTVQDQLGRISQVQQQAIVTLAKCQEKLGQEICRSADVQQQIRNSLARLAGPEGLDKRLIQIAKILHAIGLLIKQSNGRVTRPEHQAVVSLPQGGSPRQGLFQRLVKGGGNGSH
jgi:biopolymer transport protein ExbB/TolQ